MRAAIALAVVALSGCSFVLSTDGWSRNVGRDAGRDAGPDGGVDAGPPVDDPERCYPVGCNLLDHRQCAADQACYIVPGSPSESLECLPVGTVAEGGPCDEPEDCVRGTTCAFGTCVETCCTFEGGCGFDGRCIPAIGNTPEGSPFGGVCFPHTECNPVAQNCAASVLGCVHFADRGQDERVCIPVGNTAVGAPCSDFNQCVRGSRCAPQSGRGLRCRRYCDLEDAGSPCPGACAAIGDGAPAWLGLCAEP